MGPGPPLAEINTWSHAFSVPANMGCSKDCGKAQTEQIKFLAKYNERLQLEVFGNNRLTRTWSLISQP